MRNHAFINIFTSIAFLFETHLLKFLEDFQRRLTDGKLYSELHTLRLLQLQSNVTCVRFGSTLSCDPESLTHSRRCSPTPRVSPFSVSFANDCLPARLLAPISADRCANNDHPCSQEEYLFAVERVKDSRLSPPLLTLIVH